MSNITFNFTQMDGDGVVPVVVDSITAADIGAGQVGTSEIEDASIVNADVSASAAIAFSKLAALTRGSIISGQTAGNVPTALDAKGSGKILVGDGTDLASVSVSGDATLSSAGALSIANGKIKPAMLYASEALTATADGLTTGLMSGNTSHAVVTSGAATNAITLPASSAALVGKQFTIWVGANGFELLTPSTSNATINGTDSDGTNQTDIPANSLSRLTLVDTDTWILENIGSTGAVAAAITPDND